MLGDNLVEEYLFGSYARNEQTELSDIDILIIVKKFDAKIRREISSLSSIFSLEREVIISPVIKDIEVWKRKPEIRYALFTEIERTGIKLC